MKNTSSPSPTAMCQPADDALAASRVNGLDRLHHTARHYWRVDVESAAKARSHQFEFALPERPTDEILTERLADNVAEFNETNEPFRRAELMQEIRRLRDLLGERK